MIYENKDLGPQICFLQTSKLDMLSCSEFSTPNMYMTNQVLKVHEYPP